MLGFELSERTISRWMKRAPKDSDRATRWLAFLRNHREAIAAMDFFTVPTITFGVLYWHAALQIMPTPYRSHRLGGARIVFRVGIIRGLPRSSVACHKGGIHADMRLKEKALALPVFDKCPHESLIKMSNCESGSSQPLPQTIQQR
jgi:hypothetical protein